jgi:hypothetical protein
MHAGRERERNSRRKTFPVTGIKSIKEYKKKYFEMGAAIYPQKTPRLGCTLDRTRHLASIVAKRSIRLRRFNWARLIGHSKARTRRMSTPLALRKRTHPSKSQIAFSLFLVSGDRSSFRANSSGITVSSRVIDLRILTRLRLSKVCSWNSLRVNGITGVQELETDFP